MRRFGHGTKNSKELELANTILYESVPDNRVRGKPRRSWTGDIVRRVGMGVMDAVRASFARSGWRKICYQSASMDWDGLSR